jgi:uncharacterized protein
MYIKTKEIGPSGLVVDRRLTYVLPPDPEGAEAVGIGEVHLTGELRRAEDGFSFIGDITTIARLPCSRCLEPHDLPLDLHFDLLYTDAPEAPGRGENRIDERSITRAHVDGARIDLGELLAEQVYLGLPLKPLCKADCHGLCPKCGTNLNMGTCGCQEERADDPRLLVLKTLL